MCAIRLIASSSNKVNDHVQSLLLNCISLLYSIVETSYQSIIKWGNLITFAIISSRKDGNACVL